MTNDKTLLSASDVRLSTRRAAWVRNLLGTLRCSPENLRKPLRDVSERPGIRTGADSAFVGYVPNGSARGESPGSEKPLESRSPAG